MGGHKVDHSKPIGEEVAPGGIGKKVSTYSNGITIGILGIGRTSAINGSDMK